MLAKLIGLMMLANYTPSILTIPVARAEEKVWTQDMVKELARNTAKDHGLNVQKFLKTLNCENQFRAKGQSEHVYKGEREDSWGSAQINLYWNPTISKAQAEDPEFAIKWTAEKWATGNAILCSCWKLYDLIGWPEEIL